VDRATCQRIVQAAGRHGGDAGLLVTLPGVMGLRLFLDAVSVRMKDRVGQERVAAARAAVDRFELMLEDLGVSQRGLRELLEAPVPGGRVTTSGKGTADDSAVREALFRNAASVLGRWSETTIQTYIIRPVPGDATKTESVRVRALIGHAWREPAVPLEIGGTASLREDKDVPAFLTLDGEPASGNTPGSLVNEFCSQPLPRVITRAAGPRSVHVIDTDGHAGHGPVDIVTGLRSARPDPHPALLNPAVGEAWTLQNMPSGHLVFDVLLHRDLAAVCVADLESHLWMPDVTRHAAARWSTRIPESPALVQLAPGAANLRTGAYPRYAELMADVMRRVGWDLADYTTFRCEVAYPVWRAGYCMRFDFSPRVAGEEAT